MVNVCGIHKVFSSYLADMILDTDAITRIGMPHESLPQIFMSIDSLEESESLLRRVRCNYNRFSSIRLLLRPQNIPKHSTKLSV